MTGATFRIDLDDRALRGALARLGGAAGDMSPAMDEIGALLVSSTQARFEQGTTPDGTPWKPSARAAAEGGKTLIDSGILFASFTHDFGPDFAEAGTNVIYGAIHQFGGKAGRGGAVEIPQREFLGVSDDDEAEIAAILGGFIEESWRR